MNFNKEKFYKNFTTQIHIKNREHIENLTLILNKYLTKIDLKSLKSKFEENISENPKNLLNFFFFTPTKNFLKNLIIKKIDGKEYHIENNTLLFSQNNSLFLLVFEDCLLEIENFVKNFILKSQKLKFDSSEHTNEEILKIFDYFFDSYIVTGLVINEHREFFYKKQIIINEKEEKNFNENNNDIIVKEITKNKYFLKNKNRKTEKVTKKTFSFINLLITTKNLTTVEEPNIVLKTTEKTIFEIHELANNKFSISVPEFNLVENFVISNKPNFSISRFLSYSDFDYGILLNNYFFRLEDNIKKSEKIIIYNRASTCEYTLAHKNNMVNREEILIQKKLLIYDNASDQKYIICDNTNGNNKYFYKLYSTKDCLTKTFKKYIEAITNCRTSNFIFNDFNTEKNFLICNDDNCVLVKIDEGKEKNNIVDMSLKIDFFVNGSKTDFASWIDTVVDKKLQLKFILTYC